MEEILYNRPSLKILYIATLISHSKNNIIPMRTIWRLGLGYILYLYALNAFATLFNKQKA